MRFETRSRRSSLPFRSVSLYRCFPSLEGVYSGQITDRRGGGEVEARAGETLGGTVAPTMVQVMDAFDVQVGQRLRDELELRAVDGLLFPGIVGKYSYVAW